MRLVTFFLVRVKNLTGHLAYLFPAVMARLSGEHAYDAEANIFVFDRESHEAWKRGKATGRQDHTEMDGRASHR